MQYGSLFLPFVLIVHAKFMRSICAFCVLGMCVFSRCVGVRQVQGQAVECAQHL